MDIVIANAGIPLIASLVEMRLEDFRRLERVNVEGTLLTLAEAGRRMRLQGTGGDIVLISTKNVFSPGARFGAYSATKAAAHQLARIASLEMAEFGVRVNMVAPDAVFADGDRKSGLWEAIGPDRMRDKGMDAKALQEYYRKRNLLKARVTRATRGGGRAVPGRPPHADHRRDDPRGRRIARRDAKIKYYRMPTCPPEAGCWLVRRRP